MKHFSLLLTLLPLLATSAGAGELIIAHRGASKFAPENTLAAFQKADALRADYIEIDVQVSRDGELVIRHDATTQTLAELRARQTPTLEETLAAVKKFKAGLIIELKVGNDTVPGIEERVLALIDRYAMRPRVVLKSFDRRILARLYELAPRVSQLFVFVLSWPCLKFLISTRPEFTDVFQVPVQYLQIHVAFVGPGWVNEAHSHGYRVIAWGVDSAATLSKARSAGVDGVETDDPSLNFDPAVVPTPQRDHSSLHS